ncbi:MAG: hypothetical protein U9Q74_10380, partial [Gemmatimonadota bacterium]|nr:hypothetical protein [Gemmatimonadota bacterium]
RLSGAVSDVTSRDANLVTVYVTTSDPALSIAICSRIISAVNEFNLTKRHGRATAERAFTETRLADVRTALRHAEEALKSFNERNRPPLLSAQLRMEAQRLQREVDLQQSLFLSLAQALEQAKIDEVRDTPVVTVVERPDLTVARELNPLIAALTFALIATATAATALWIRQRH